MPYFAAQTPESPVAVPVVVAVVVPVVVAVVVPVVVVVVVPVVVPVVVVTPASVSVVPVAPASVPVVPVVVAVVTPVVPVVVPVPVVPAVSPVVPAVAPVVVLVVLVVVPVVVAVVPAVSPVVLAVVPVVVPPLLPSPVFDASPASAAQATMHETANPKAPHLNQQPLVVGIRKSSRSSSICTRFRHLETSNARIARWEKVVQMPLALALDKLDSIPKRVIDEAAASLRHFVAPARGCAGEAFDEIVEPVDYEGRVSFARRTEVPLDADMNLHCRCGRTIDRRASREPEASDCVRRSLVFRRAPPLPGGPNPDPATITVL